MGDHKNNVLAKFFKDKKPQGTVIPGARKPKSVLIAYPTFGLEPDPNKWMSTVLGTLNEFMLRGFKANFYPAYRRPIMDAENEIVQCAITTGADYILRIDDDIWGYQQGFVNKLIDADKEYISGCMFAAGFPYSRCAFKRKDPAHTLVDIFKNKLMELDEVEGPGVQPCDLTATPYTLIKTTIYEKILTPYYENVPGVSMDSVFCQKLLDAGIQPYCHLDVQLNHRHVTWWNRHFLFNADARMLLGAKQIDRNTPLFKLLAPEFGELGEKDPLMLKMLKLAVNGTQPIVI